VEEAVFVHESKPVKQFMHDSLAFAQGHGALVASLSPIAVLGQVGSHELEHEV
jgi:hypothetical protein